MPKEKTKKHGDRILIFFGTYQVLKAEKLLLREGIEVSAIAAPRHISTECGICIKFHRNDEKRVLAAIAAAHMEITGVYNN